MKKQDNAKQHMNMLALLMLIAPVVLMTAGCGEIDGGQVQNTVDLPVDSELNFHCEDEGIFPEDCVLDNPQNPYANVAVTEDNKFDLSDDAPSAKSKYYVWATALAKGAGIQGENQFYTAKYLHEVYGEIGSLTTRDQARKAYRSVLDNFFLSVSFDILDVPELLNNGGFGLPDASGGDIFCHTGWECENDSFTTAADGPNPAPVSHDGNNQSAKQSGNNALSFQVVPTIQINDVAEITYEATVWAMNWTGNGTTDPFTESGYIELSALDAGGGVLAAEYVYVVPSVNLLNNGGFGLPDASGGDVLCHTGWECENESYTTAADGPNSAPVSHNPQDNQSIKQFGNNGLTFQAVNATEGRTYRASVSAMNWTGNGTTDPFTGRGFLELSFLDAAGDVITDSEQQPYAYYVYVDAVDDGTNVYLPPQDGAEVSDWTELTISEVAPAGTVSVRMRLAHQLADGSGGTLRWDDASITVVDDGGVVNLPPQDGTDVSDWRELSLTVVAPEGAASVKLLLAHQLAGGSGGSLRWDDVSLVAQPTKVIVVLKDQIGKNLITPGAPGAEGLVSLYDDPEFAISDLNNWGYDYDTGSEIMSIIEP